LDAAIGRPPATADSFDKLGKVAAGAAGVGVGVVFAYRLFDDLGVKELMEAGTTYGLTVLALVGVIVLITGYAALPSAQVAGVKGTVRAVLLALVCLATGGMIFQMRVDSNNPPVGVNVDFSPALSEVNLSNHFSADNALDAVLEPPTGASLSLISGQLPKPVYVRNTQRILIRMDTLPQLISSLRVQAAARAECANGNCATQAHP
jgi:hypothetical protein